MIRLRVSGSEAPSRRDSAAVTAQFSECPRPPSSKRAPRLSSGSSTIPRARFRCKRSTSPRTKEASGSPAVSQPEPASQLLESTASNKDSKSASNRTPHHENLQPFRLGPRPSFAGLVFHDRLHGGGSLRISAARATGRSRFHDQDHGDRGAMAGRFARGNDAPGHRQDREEARGTGIARLHQERHR